jgi:hypothetical protein
MERIKNRPRLRLPTAVTPDRALSLENTPERAVSVSPVTLDSVDLNDPALDGHDFKRTKQVNSGGHRQRSRGRGLIPDHPTITLLCNDREAFD